MLLFVKFLILDLLFKISDQAPVFELGNVPYFFDEKVYGQSVLEKVQEAFAEIESHSCLKFIQAQDENATLQFQPRGLHITNREKTRECVHKISPIYFGWVMPSSLNPQTVTLGFDCLEQRQILHTLLHGLGMKDEVTNPERDQYVRVMWANIAPEYRSLYQLDSEYSPRPIEYDPQSVMQFHDRAFSVNGKPTLEPLVPGMNIEPSEHLSQLDALRLHNLFNKQCINRDINEIMETCKYSLRHRNDKETPSHFDAEIDPNESEDILDNQKDEELDLGSNGQGDYIDNDPEQDGNFIEPTMVENSDADAVEEHEEVDVHSGVEK